MKKFLLSVMFVIAAIFYGATPASAAQKTGLYPEVWNVRIGDSYYNANYGAYGESKITYSDDVKNVEKNVLLKLADVDPEAKYFSKVTYQGNTIYMATYKEKKRLAVYSYDLTTKSLRKISVITGNKVKGYSSKGFFANGSFYFQGAKSLTKAGKVKSYGLYRVNLTNGAIKLWKKDLRIPDWIPVQRCVNKESVDSLTYVHFTDAKGRPYLYNFKTCKGITLKNTGKYIDMDGKKCMDNVPHFMEYKNLVFAIAWDGNSDSMKPVKATIYKINVNKKSVKKLKSYKAHYLYTIDYVTSRFVRIVDSELGSSNKKSVKNVKY